MPVTAIVGAAPTTLLVNGVAATLFPGARLDGFAALYPLVLTISLPMQALTWLIGVREAEMEARAAAPRPTADPAPVAAPLASAAVAAPLPSPAAASEAPILTPDAARALFDKLPGRIGREVSSLEMEDHYVRVRTRAGEAMIHLRMADAETALAAAGLEGLRVHRSWWVARAAVSGWTRDGKTLTLTLSDGREVPVARDRQPLVRAAGWLS